MILCRRWGHKFEARYEDVMTTINCGGNLTLDIKALEALKSKRYIHDICVRCGQTVDAQGAKLATRPE